MHWALTERGRVLDVGMDPLVFSNAGRVGDGRRHDLGGRHKLPEFWSHSPAHHHIQQFENQYKNQHIFTASDL